MNSQKKLKNKTSIIFSDKSEDMYESNLMRRICGLLYVSDADNGKIKEKIKLLNKWHT